MKRDGLFSYDQQSRTGFEQWRVSFRTIAALGLLTPAWKEDYEKSLRAISNKGKNNQHGRP